MPLLGYKSSIPILKLNVITSQDAARSNLPNRNMLIGGSAPLGFWHEQNGRRSRVRNQQVILHPSASFFRVKNCTMPILKWLGMQNLAPGGNVNPPASLPLLDTVE